MGGKSKSSTAQTDNSTVDNRAIQQEENNGIQVLGEGNKVYSTTTDHGAMDAAEEIAQTAGNLGRDAFNTAGDLGRDAFNSAGALGKDAMNTAVDLAEISAETTEHSFDFAESVAIDSLNGMQDLSADVVETLAQSNFDNTQLIAGISSSQMSQNEEQLNAITELAKSAQTGGISEMAKEQTKMMLVFGVVVLVGLAIWGSKK